MPKLPRIALLVCDKPIPQVASKYGEYPVMFTDLLRSSLPPSISAALDAGTALLDAYDVRFAQEYPDEIEYDALILTGSSASAYEEAHWIYRVSVAW